MRFSIVSAHLPELEGVAPGRVTRALSDGLVEVGHDVELWTWNGHRPTEVLPDWCRWAPLPDASWMRTKLRSVTQPRTDVLRAGWRPPDDAIALADEASSFPAVATTRRSALILHQLMSVDMFSAGVRPSTSIIQRLRAQRRAVLQAPLVLCTSPRVASAIGGDRVKTVPITHTPAPVLPLVDAPIAGVLANWGWPPNQWALDVLLRSWPEVRSRVPGARLLLGGHGLKPVGSQPGLEILGVVPRSEDLLSRISVLAFPCPPSTGAKIKVLEAIGRGVPVVTTPDGIEGLQLSPGGGARTTTIPDFATALASLLRDPGERAALSAQGVADIATHHAPARAADALAEACRPLLDA